MAQVDWTQFSPVDAAPNSGVDWSKFTPVDTGPDSAPNTGGIDFDAFVTRIEGRESGGDPNAISPQGAKGAMQVMPGTFKDYARPGESFDNENDRRAVALRKLRSDWDFYGGDPMRVAAAYIGGRGAVRDDGSIRDDVADAHGTTPLAYAQQVVLGGREKQQASGPTVDVSKYGTGYFSSAQTKPAKEKDPGIMSSAGRGAARGLTDMASAVGSGVQFIGERLAAKGMADYGKRVADAWEEVGQQFEPQKSIQGSILDDPKLLTKGAWWAYNIANVVPSFAASVVPGVAAGRGIQVLGQTMKWTPEIVSRLAWLGGSIVGGAAGGSLEGAQTYQEVQKRGGSEPEAAAAGTQMALASAALNAISLGNLTAKAKNVVTKFLKTGVWEGLTEWAEEPAEGAILSRTSVAKPEDDPMLRAREGFNVFPVAAVTGGIGGAMSGTRAPKPEARPGAQDDQQILDAVAQSEEGKTPESIEAAAVPQSGAAPGVVSTEAPAATRIPEIESELSAIAEQLQAAGVDPQSEIAQRMQSRVAALEDERARLAGTAEPSQTIQYQPPAAPTEAEQAAQHLADTRRQYRDNQIAQEVSQAAVPYERVAPPAASAPAPATEPAAQPVALPERLELVPIERGASEADRGYDFSRLKSFGTPQSAALAAARALQETGGRHDIVVHPTQPNALAIVPSGSGMAAAVTRAAAPSVAMQDAGRMGSIESLAVDDNGSLALPENEPIMRAFLQSLPAAEAAAMIDAQGRVTQIGMRRFQNAVLARAYGGNPVIQKLISGKTAFAQRLSASLTKMAPMVSAIKEAVQQQAVADRDITDTVVSAVDELVRMKAEGRKPGQVIAQSGLFQDVSPETAALVEFIEENLNAPDRMNAFLQAYLEELQRYGSDQQGQLFSGPGAPQGAELIDAARSRMDGQPQFEQPTANEVTDVQGGEVPEGEGSQSAVRLQDGAGEAAGDAGVASAGAGTADTAAVSGAPETGRQRGDGPVDGADVGRSAGEGESDAVAAQDAPEAASDQVEKSEVPTEAQEQDAAAKIAEASREAAHSPENDKPLPSRAQIEAGNYALGHVRLFGLDISIENPKGSTRTGIDPGGQPWQVKMVAAYGYLKKTTARDGDHVDVYLTGNPTEQTPVFVVDQIDPATGRFDEHKVVLGATTRAEAEALYDAHFSDKSGPQRRGAVRQWTLERFKTWLKTGNTKRPVAYKEPKAQKAETKPASRETTAASRESKSGEPKLSRPATKTQIRSSGIPVTADPPLSTVASVGAMQSHPDYRAAKAGDVDAAARLVSALVPQSSINAAGERFGADVVYAFAHAVEASGENAIPAVLAYAYANGTGANVDDNIVQSNRAFHTGANAMQRLISRPTFDGPVQAGKQYVLVDDVITLGGTLAELAAHIQAGGGQVVGVATLVNAGRSARMTPPARFISELERRLGDVIREEFGVDPAALTASEAQYLIGFRNADELRNRAASAKRERADRLRARGIEESPIREEGGVSDPTLSMPEAPERGLSASGDTTRDRVMAELEERLGRAPDDNAVSVIESWRDLPDDRRKFIESRRAFDVQGMFDPDTGRVYLIADNLPPGGAFSVFMHEIGVHKGLRSFIGAESFGGLVKQIRTWADLSMGEEGKIARTALARIPADTEATIRDEESVAYFVEEAVRRGHDIPQSRPGKRGLGQWLYDLWQAVRGALAKLRAEPATLTAADVVALARGAAEKAMGPGEAQYTGSVAEPALSVAPGQPATWDAPEASRLDDILYTLQDKHIDTRRVMQAITKHSGAAVADTIDPYLQEELFHGRAAKQVDDFLQTELKPLLADMTQRGVTMQELEAYLHARHAEERNAQIAKVNPSMLDGGSGMTTKDARAYLAAIDPAKRRSFDALAKRVDAITAGTRSTLVANGLESPNAIKAWESAYKHYVPLYREDMEGAPGVGQGFSVKGPASKRAMGSSAAVTDVIANIAMQRERAIVRAEKNRVANALVGLAQANPNPDFWQVDRPPMIRYIDERTGLVTERVDPMFKSRDNVVTARLPDANGEIIERSVSFNETDERAMRMARALKNLDTDDLGLFLSASAKITRYLASVNTQFNPIFGIVNITRDVQGALANLSSTPLAGKQSAVLGNTLSALRGIYRDLRDVRSGKQPSSQWSALFEEFQLEGGQTGYRDMFRTSKDRAEAIEKELRKVTEGKAKALGRAVFDWLSDYNNSMENAVRLAAYKVGVDAGMSKQRAASLAKNLTVNFNRKGQAATQLGAVYAFFNASTQGTARLVETLRGPMGKRIIMGGLLAGVMQALLIAASDLGDDDDALKDFVKERNLVIPIGDKQYLTIPMPLGLHVLPNIGRIGAEFALSGFKKPGDRLVSLMGVLAEAFNPIGSAGVSVQTIAPSAVDPFVALAENKDWGGRQIARKDFSSLNPTPGHTRAKDSSSWISRELSRALNWATGGTEYTPGLFSPTPDQIDYLVGQVFGGVGREFMKTWETAETGITGEDLPSYKVPLLGRFYGNADEPASHAGRFYETIKEIHVHAAEIKGRRRDGEDVAGYIEEHPEARLIEAAKAAERRVSRLRKQRRELDQDDAGREALRAIDDRINAEIRRFNDRVRAVSRQESEAAVR